MHETTHGIYEALLSGRFAFDFVHEDRLELDRISKYRALLLPNIAMLSDRQCQQIRDYVQSGGSIMASFETSLYDENLQRREEFGLADLLGITRPEMSSERTATRTMDGSNAVIRFLTASQTPTGCRARKTVCPSKRCRIRFSRLFPASCSILRSWPTHRPRTPMSQQSCCVKSAPAALAYFPGDIERTFWLTGHGDLLAPAAQHHPLDHSRRSRRPR